MNGLIEHDPDASEYVEVDPTGRYGRYNEILGKGASKIVYRAFDEYEGIEVAWNQVKLTDFLQRPEDLERLYSEIHLLKTLKHKNIMTYYTSWVDTANRNINFVTEMFTSGTLRQYRLKHKKVNIRAVKHWCRQILSGLLYLHSLDHPVIHRDLKCDNIFINGNQGEVKIGDLGLAAILRKSHAARCVGTPEFMAPEVYAEEYNELVDIYSFGMCVLEMVTFEYPYSECTHSAQIYKKVTSGKKPEALYKVKDPEVRQFVEKCLATVSHRLSAKELLMDLFLQEDDGGYDLRPIDSYESVSLAQFPYQNCGALMNGCYTYPRYEEDHELDHQALEFETSEIDLFASLEDDQLANTDISIKGKRRGDGGIFLRLRIADEEGRVRNIYFPFDIETDTALIVATEMVSELDITGQDVTRIAEMIDEEIASLVPDWKGGLSLEEVEGCTNSNAGYSHSRAPSFSLSDYVSSDKTRTQNIQVLHCSAHESAAVSGRFEEVMYYQTDSDGVQYTDIWAQRESCEPEESSSQKGEKFNKTDDHGEDDDDRDPRTPYNSPVSSVVCDPEHENEIREELRWLKAKYQIQLRELKDHQLGGKSGKPSLTVLKRQNGFRNKKMTVGSPENRPDKNDLKIALDRHFASYFPSNGDQGKGANMGSRDIQNASNDSYSEEDMVTAKSFYTGTLLPSSLHRATSLPVDAVDC